MHQSHDSQRYLALGVSSAKDAVHSAIARLPAGLLKNSFCRVVEDIFTGDADYCVVSHADGAGTKSILAYLHYATFGDCKVFKGIAQDAVVMNLDDLICVGARRGFAVTSIINRNAKRIGSEVVKAIVEGTQEFVDRMNQLGITMALCGGETADVGDITKTILVDSVISVRMLRNHLIRNEIKPGQVIVGLPSWGAPCSYEDAWNSGIGSNGLTAARHELLAPSIRHSFPEVFDESIDENLVYRGPFGLRDSLPGSEQTVLDALLSPTRTFAPIIVAVLDEYSPAVSGLVHCTGGGQLKCLRFGHGVRYVKDLGDTVPPLFRAIRDSSHMEWHEMAKIFNLGYRMEIFCDPRVADNIIDVARAFNLSASVIGHTEQAQGLENSLRLSIEEQVYEYANTGGGESHDGE